MTGRYSSPSCRPHTTRIPAPRVVQRQGGRHPHRRGVRPLSLPGAPGRAGPLGDLRGHPGRKGRRRGDGGQPIRFGRHGHPSHPRSRQAAAVLGAPHHRTARERRSAWTTCCAPTRSASSSAYQGFYSVQSGEEAGKSCSPCHARTCRRDRFRQRPDGHRGAQGPEPGGHPGSGGHSRGRLRRHLPRQPVRSPAHHGSSADAHAGRAGLRPPARPHRRPGAARDRTAAHRTRPAVKLRLPARHRYPPAGADTRRAALQAHPRAQQPPSPKPARRRARQAAKA